jgi:RNA polymerase primary sigma factor
VWSGSIHGQGEVITVHVQHAQHHGGFGPPDGGRDEDLSLAAPAQYETELCSSADSVRAYLNQLGKVDLLTAEQEVQLGKRIETGLYAAERIRHAQRTPHQVPAQLAADLRWLVGDGQRAKQHLIEANLRLVVSLAKRYTGLGMPLLDLIQEGNLGLIHAVEKFDYTKGIKFSTYATWWIRQAITRALADQARTIRIPFHLMALINKLGRLRRELGDNLGRDPTPDELAARTGLTPDKVLELQDYARAPVSLNQAVGHDSDAHLGDVLEDPQAVTVVDKVSVTLLHDQLHRVLATLPHREAEVVRLRFGLTDGQPRTLRQISQIYKVSPGCIQKIEAKTMTKLRRLCHSQSLRDYLD